MARLHDTVTSGYEEGHFNGKQEGRAEGLAEGIERGIEKGIEEEKMRNAKAMKEIGIETKKIAQITGLSIQEIDRF